MHRMKSSGYYFQLYLLIGISILIGFLLLTCWNVLSPYGTIALSVELGVIVTIVWFYISNRKKVVLSSSIERTSARIAELTGSFQKISTDLINIHQELEHEIDNNKNQLELLQLETTEASKKAQEKKEELDVLERTNPKIVQIMDNLNRRYRRWDYFYAFILFVAGVFTPYIITYLMTHFSP